MTRKAAQRRIVSVWFPDLAMERWRALARRIRTPPGDDAPVVLARSGAHGPVIHACGAEAIRRGVRIGGRVVDAQALHPDLHVETADPEGDSDFLKKAAQWARRWCPWTTADIDGIVLDTTGAAHLFGGEAALLRDMRRRFAMQGLTARLAMAPTPGAAQALARHGSAATICGAEDVAECLAPLPVIALRIDPDTAHLLDRLGLKTIAALMGIPRAALMRRFAGLKAGGDPLVLLDRALGRLSDPLDAPPDPECFLARARSPEPALDPVPHIKGLAEALSADLAKAERGARRLRLTIYRIDGEWRELHVAMARASRDPVHISRLFDGKFETIDPGFGFDLLTLEAVQVEPLSLHQDRLDGGRDPEADIAVLVDRLTARLGDDKVTWSAWRESHIPERAETHSLAIGAAMSAPPAIARDRPLRLLDAAEEIRVIYAVPEGPPARFRWRRIEHHTIRHQGPERIAPEWWRDNPGARLRDYYKIEIEDGRRFWLYREGVLGDRRGGDPRWFLHGFFA